VVALLGPTNTGKTHRAIQRMLEHSSGMIGLPLRLLAREIYDRVSSLRGEDAVALITGEERRIGRDARYFICTVEAMPVDKPVSFIAVDEIQLAGDANRGHVFTDRILYARGLRETFFLGSLTIAPLLQRLIPGIDIRSYQRYSSLSYRAPIRLNSLPPRTALVAFSVERVYALAEELRRRHGGTAVVLGALSPRTRNAQVAMYQAGEVRYMVATDAIGMGLNMDIDHVAFDGLRKFDGQTVRELYPQEVGQIAGRAGRYRKDGSFSPTEAAGAFNSRLVERVEKHDYPTLKTLFYRNSSLDFSTPALLLASLRRPSGSICLVDAKQEEDELFLREILRDPDIYRSIQTPEALQLLWEVCRIPDFRKTLTDSHLQLLKQLYGFLIKGYLSEDFLNASIQRLDRPEGDVDALTTRLAWVRTWTYVTHKSEWLGEKAEEWQAQARAVEDRLSDALHASLTERFVDPSSRILGRRIQTVGEEGEVHVGGVRAGKLMGLCFQLDPAVSDARIEKHVRSQLQAEIQERLERAVAAQHKQFSQKDLVIFYQDGPVARLLQGPSLLEPQLKLVRNELLGPGDQARLLRRLSAWLKDEVLKLTAFFDVPGLSRPVRALSYRLQEGLGSIPRQEVQDLVREFRPADWALVKNMKIQVGDLHAFCRPLLTPEFLSLRLWLAALFLGLSGVPLLEPQRRREAEAQSKELEGREGVPDRLYALAGYQRLQGELFRVDQLQAVVERVRSRKGPIPVAQLVESAKTPERAVIVAGHLGWELQGEQLVPRGWR
jgi:ATP-dependent RNA helicase SUPV3L1/SUV3